MSNQNYYGTTHTFTNNNGSQNPNIFLRAGIDENLILVGTVEGGGGDIPHYFVHSTSSQSIPHFTNTVVSSYLDAVDSSNGITFNSGIFTVPSDGLYHFSYSFLWQNGGGDYRLAECLVNSGSLGFGYSRLSPDSTFVSNNASGTLNLKSGDTLEFRVDQNSGSSLLLNTFNTHQMGYVSIIKLS